MASVPKTPGPAELPLFRFRLRHLFAFFAIFSAFLTELVVSQGVVGLVLVVATLVVMAHVTATALGSRLRECSPRAERDEIERRRTESREAPSAGRELPVARSLWYGHDRSPLARLPLLVVIGLALGGVGGALVLTWTIGDHTSLAGLAVGAISISVLGGWFAFLATSFCTIFRQGWNEAVEQQRRDQTRRVSAVVKR